MPKYFLYLLLILTCFNSAKAQNNLDSLKERYPDDNIVILSVMDSLVINSDSDISQFHSITNQVIRPIKPDRLNTSISYDDFSPIKYIKADVSRIKDDGTKEVSDKVNKSYQNRMVSGVFYHDNKAVEISYPFFSEGTISKLEYEQEVMMPQFLNLFVFSKGFPTQHSKLVIYCHKSVDLGYTLFNNPGENLSFVKEDGGDYWLYKWEMHDVKPWDAYSYKEILLKEPHLVPRIKSVQKEEEVTVFLKDMKSFYGWLYSLVEPLMIPNPEMAVLSQEITKGLTADLEKMKAIYNWVQTNINYVAFEDGYNGFIPRKPEDVCKKKYGDCKDMAMLLYTLLKNAGIDANIVWIGTDDIPYKIEEVLTFHAFNHMIACADIEGKKYWLDGTAKYLDFNLTSPFTQGKEALIADSQEKYEIVTIPITEIRNNVAIDSIQISVLDKQLIGSRTYNFKGYEKLDFLFDIYNFDETRNEDFSEYFSMGNDSYKHTSFNVVKNDGQREENAIVKANFIIDNYTKTFGNKLLINPLLNKFSNGMIFDTTLINTINFEYNSRSIEVIDLQLDGRNIQNMPENVLIDENLIKYVANYTLKEDHLIIERIFEIKQYYLEKSDAVEWNIIIKQISKLESENLVLIKS